MKYCAAMETINTPRLTLRHWEKSDLPPFTAMGSDVNVMRYFPSLLDRDQTMMLYSKIQAHFDTHSFGMYAVEERSSNTFIGFIGLHHVNFDAPFTPCIEIGWRLARSAWNKGYATEGALACLDFAFRNLSLTNIYSFTPVSNKSSERVMQKIGMNKVGNFEHPNLDAGHPLKPHVLYTIKYNDKIFL